jgi:hypothetical protein
MKKSLLLSAALFAAVVFVKAQSPTTWIAGDYCTGLGLEADAIALTPNQQITAGDITLTAQDADGKGWKYKTSTDADFTYNGVTYKAAQVQGQTNPLAGRLLNAGGGCAIAIFESASSGTLDIAFKFGYNKKFWVAAVPTADLALLNKDDSLECSAYKYEFTEGQYYWSGYLDPMTSPATYYDAASPNYTEAPVDGAVYYTGITLNVEPDYQYFVFFSGSKIMLCGFTYTVAAAVEYSISGKVALANGNAVEGVLITSSDSKTATTDASGLYSLTGITETSVTLTPSKTNFTFNPATLTLTMDKDYIDQDFIATDISGTIPKQVSGTVTTSDGTPIEGVLVSCSDGKSMTTGSDGIYSITDITALSTITLTPSKTDYTFNPASITLTMDKDYNGQDFVGTKGDAIIDNTSNATIISTEYYNIIGQKIERPRIGELNIIVNKMSDGTVKAVKKYIKE